MSFHFNLSASSSSEGEDEENDQLFFENDDEGKNRIETLCDQEEQKELDWKKSVTPSNDEVLSQKLANNSNGNSDEDDEEEVLDWEDGNEEEELKQVTSLFLTKEVTIDIKEDRSTTTKDTSSSARKKIKRPRVLRKLTNLPLDIIQLIRNLHQTHLLALSAGAVYSFQQILRLRRCSLLAHLACSLIPIRFLDSIERQPDCIPTYHQLKDFTQWYFEWIGGAQQRINNIRQRNRAMGAPSTIHSYFPESNMCGCCSAPHPNEILHEQMHSILNQLASSYDHDTNTNIIINITDRDKLNLYIFICYACFRWTHIRLVSAFLPIGLELTCSHPLLIEQDSKVATPASHPLSSMNYGSNITAKRRKRLKHEVIDLTEESVMGTAINSMDMNSFHETISKISSYLVASRKDRSTAATAASCDLHAWVEVLCRVDYRTTRSNDSDCQNHSSKAADTKHGKTTVYWDKNNLKWIHIENQYEFFDQPDVVEHILATLVRGQKLTDGGQRVDNLEEATNSSSRERLVKTISTLESSASKPKQKTSNASQRHVQLQQRRLQQQICLKKALISGKTSKKNKGRQPVSYVLAVEHRIANKKPSKRHPSDKNFRTVIPGIYLTDVTPRYSSSWSETLRLRGATGREIVASSSNYKSSWPSQCFNSAILWWEDILKKVNTQNKYSIEQPLLSCKNDILCIDIPPQEIETKRFSFVNGEDIEDSKCLESVQEEREFKAAISSEAIPTSKVAFKNHPLYVIPSVLKEAEVLVPDAKARVCGIFKGELVYKRCDVSPALSAKKWLYEGQKVRENELAYPVKTIAKKRENQRPKLFKALATYGFKNKCASQDSFEEAGSDDQEQCSSLAALATDGKVPLYGKWQTDTWCPRPIGQSDDIPRNEYGNVEKSLINPGLVHLEEPRISFIAKRLGIPYAPCLIGFEGHHGNRSPTVRGIVVHQHNVELLREAYAEFESHSIETELDKRQKMIYWRWKKLIVGIRTKARLERDYKDAKEMTKK